MGIVIIGFCLLMLFDAGVYLCTKEASSSSVDRVLVVANVYNGSAEVRAATAVLLVGELSHYFWRLLTPKPTNSKDASLRCWEDGGPGTIDGAGSVSTQDRYHSLPPTSFASFYERACLFSVLIRHDATLRLLRLSCVCVSACVVLSLSPAGITHTLYSRVALLLTTGRPAREPNVRAEEARDEGRSLHVHTKRHTQAQRESTERKESTEHKAIGQTETTHK